MRLVSCRVLSKHTSISLTAPWYQSVKVSAIGGVGIPLNLLLCDIYVCLLCVNQCPASVWCGLIIRKATTSHSVQRSGPFEYYKGNRQPGQPFTVRPRIHFKPKGHVHFVQAAVARVSILECFIAFKGLRLCRKTVVRKRTSLLKGDLDIFTSSPDLMLSELL